MMLPACRRPSISSFITAVPLLLIAAALGVSPAPASADSGDTPKVRKTAKVAPDRSGKPRKGKASYYGREFYGKKMADGTPMNPHSNIAASRTLPLGTKARVTNLENGKSEVVVIRDRGPYVDGRIVDLTPATAEKLDFREQGLALVEVTPLEIPGSSTTLASSGP